MHQSAICSTSKGTNGLRLLADQLGWIPQPGGWLCDEQYFTWSEADYKVKWVSSRVLLPSCWRKSRLSDLTLEAWKPASVLSPSDN
eukprot:6438439-Amphidinium_carterae.2